MVYKFFDKKSSANGGDTSLANKFATESIYQLANELHRQIIKKFKKFIRRLETIFGVLI